MMAYLLLLSVHQLIKYIEIILFWRWRVKVSNSALTYYYFNQPNDHKFITFCLKKAHQIDFCSSKQTNISYSCIYRRYFRWIQISYKFQIKRWFQTGPVSLAPKWKREVAVQITVFYLFCFKQLLFLCKPVNSTSPSEHYSN